MAVQHLSVRRGVLAGRDIELPDGTHIYDCLSCGRLWAERLVTFEVTFRLVEVMGNGHDGNGGAPESVMAMASSS